MKLTNSLRELNIITFFDILLEGNTKLLDVDYSTNKEYTEPQLKEIDNTWLSLYDRYFELKNDIQAKSYLQNQSRLLELNVKIKSLQVIHDKLAEINNIYVNDTLQAVNFEIVAETKQNAFQQINLIDDRIKIKPLDSIHEICTKLQSVLKAFSNELNTISTNQEKRAEKVKNNVFDIIVSVEVGLEMKLGNPKEISVEQFIAYENKLKEKIKRMEKNKLKK